MNLIKQYFLKNRKICWKMLSNGFILHYVTNSALIFGCPYSMYAAVTIYPEKNITIYSSESGAVIKEFKWFGLI